MRTISERKRLTSRSVGETKILITLRSDREKSKDIKVKGIDSQSVFKALLAIKDKLWFTFYSTT